jgi:hypothetical protein
MQQLDFYTLPDEQREAVLDYFAQIEWDKHEAAFWFSKLSRRAQDEIVSRDFEMAEGGD